MRLLIAGWSQTCVQRRAEMEGCPNYQHQSRQTCAPFFFAVPGIENLPAFLAQVLKFWPTDHFSSQTGGVRPTGCDHLRSDPDELGRPLERTASAAVIGFGPLHVEAYVSDAFQSPLRMASPWTG